jgi:hypothetical protein
VQQKQNIINYFPQKGKLFVCAWKLFSVKRKKGFTCRCVWIHSDVLFFGRKRLRIVFAKSYFWHVFCFFLFSRSFSPNSTQKNKTFTLNISLKKQNKHFINNGNNTTASVSNDKLLRCFSRSRFWGESDKENELHFTFLCFFFAPFFRHSLAN